jgi:hypothetical protein
VVRHSILVLSAGTLLAAMMAIAAPMSTQAAGKRTPEQI